MPEQSTQSIVVDADPTAVMAVVADFAHYPDWTGSVKSAEVVTAGADGRAERVAFVLDAGILRDEYELAYTWDGDDRVDWRLVRGQVMRSQTGSYVLRALPGGRTEVTYSLAVELSIPILGMLKRKAERVIMDTALRQLKDRVENGAG